MTTEQELIASLRASLIPDKIERSTRQIALEELPCFNASPQRLSINKVFIESYINRLIKKYHLEINDFISNTYDEDNEDLRAKIYNLWFNKTVKVFTELHINSLTCEFMKSCDPETQKKFRAYLIINYFYDLVKSVCVRFNQKPYTLFEPAPAALKSFLNKFTKMNFLKYYNDVFDIEDPERQTVTFNINALTHQLSFNRMMFIPPLGVAYKTVDIPHVFRSSTDALNLGVEYFETSNTLVQITERITN